MKCAVHLIFIPRRCHSFCSFNGFRHLVCHSGNAERGSSRNTDGHLLLAGEQRRDSWRRRSKWMCVPAVWIKAPVPLTGMLSKGHTFDVAAGRRSKNSNGQLHIATGEPLWRSIREMLTFFARTIGFPALRVRRRKHGEPVNLESSADADFYLRLCDYGQATDSV